MWNMSKNTSSRGKLFGHSTIYGKEGEHATPYMTRIWFGRLRFHIFHRPDNDPDCHDHPWGFWTFPLVSYVEEVAVPQYVSKPVNVMPEGEIPRWRYRDVQEGFTLKWQLVKAWRWHYRPATHTHRVVGAYAPVGEGDVQSFDPTKKIYTFVWREHESREWGFLKTRDGRWCWVAFRDYVYGNAKHAPCE